VVDGKWHRLASFFVDLTDETFWRCCLQFSFSSSATGRVNRLLFVYFTEWVHWCRRGSVTRAKDKEAFN
jgi:hypothetical protein